MPQQRVEGAADLPDLGRGVQVRLLHAVLDAHLAALQRLRGHAVRSAGHPLQRRQRGTHHGPPSQGHHEGAHQGHRQLDEQLGADERLVPLQGETGDDRAARGLVTRGHHPVAAQMVQVDGDGVVLGGLGQQQPAVLLGDGRVVAVLVDVGGGLAAGGRRLRRDERQRAGRLPGGVKTWRDPLLAGVAVGPARPVGLASRFLRALLDRLIGGLPGLLRQVVALVGGTLSGRHQLTVRPRHEGVAQADGGEGAHDCRHDQDQPEHSDHQPGAQAARRREERAGPPRAQAHPLPGRCRLLGHLRVLRSARPCRPPA